MPSNLLANSRKHVHKKKLIELWLNENSIENYQLREDLTIDVFQDIILEKLKDKTYSLPAFIQFATIEGTFDCSFCNLQSLKGMPEKITKTFNCAHNRLETLQFGPKEVGLGYFCHNNSLVSLLGAPEKTGANFNAEVNCLKTLAGSPKEVGKNFMVGKNQLASLLHGPETVMGSYLADNNRLDTLTSCNTTILGNVCATGNFLTEIQALQIDCLGTVTCDWVNVFLPLNDFQKTDKNLLVIPREQISHYLLHEKLEKECSVEPLGHIKKQKI